MAIFDQETYKVTTVGADGEAGTEDDQERTFSPYYFDGSDALANQNYLIHVTHVPTNKMIRFKAFITSFNDTFSYKNEISESLELILNKQQERYH